MSSLLILTFMKICLLLVTFIICSSFRPTVQKAASAEVVSSGFYVFVNDFTERTKHSYIIESRDSVDVIFKLFFRSELELGDVDRPLTIYNGEHDFYVARVSVIHKSNGKLGFNNLKYPKLKIVKRNKLDPVTL